MVYEPWHNLVKASLLDSTLLPDSTLVLHSCWAFCSASSAPIFYWALTCLVFDILCLECLSLPFTSLSPANPSGLHLDIISCRKFSLKHPFPTRSRSGASPMGCENPWTSHECTYYCVWKLNAHVPSCMKVIHCCFFCWTHNRQWVLDELTLYSQF